MLYPANAADTDWSAGLYILYVTHHAVQTVFSYMSGIYRNVDNNISLNPILASNIFPINTAVAVTGHCGYQGYSDDQDYCSYGMVDHVQKLV